MRRIGAAVLASAWGLVVGAAAAGVLGSIRVLLSPGLEIATSPRALVLAPLMMAAAGLWWSLLGGAMLVFPLAVVVLALFRPQNTLAGAIAVSALLLAPLVFVNFTSRPLDTLLLTLPTWIGVRVALRMFARRMPG